MRNAKSPPLKMSNVMKTMNKLLLSVFVFQILICTGFSLANFLFRFSNNKFIEIYIEINQLTTITSIIGKFFTFLVAYSHLIPISLYVAMEILKLVQSWLVFYDNVMFDTDAGKAAQAKTSELIEELGQVEFVFSDKTGTLTQNKMEFKKCLIGGRIYGDTWADDNERANDVEIRNFVNKYSINEDTSAYKMLSGDNYDSSLNNNEAKNLIEFFMVASICHSAIVEKDSTENLKYSSSSPDEICLLQGSMNMGFIMENRTTDTIKVYNIYNKKVKFGKF